MGWCYHLITCCYGLHDETSSLSLSFSPHTHTTHHPYDTQYLGVDFYSKALKVDERIISLQLWDTAGQERFQSVTKAYYRGAQGVILMYDITQEESFIAVKSWINSIQVPDILTHNPSPIVHVCCVLRNCTAYSA